MRSAFVLIALASPVAAIGQVAVPARPPTVAITTDELRRELDALATFPGEPQQVSAAGMTRDETPLLTLEDRDAFAPASGPRRLVIVGGLDGNGDSARLALRAVRWFKETATASVRQSWKISALPLADPLSRSVTEPNVFPPENGFFDHPERPESRAVWRWVSYQAPDLVVELRAGNALRIVRVDARTTQMPADLPAGSLVRALAAGHGPIPGAVDGMHVTARSADVDAVMRDVLSLARQRSNLRAAIDRRTAREPLALARLLAGRYPAMPEMNYVPALAWAYALRVATLSGDATLRAKVMRDVDPWLSGTQPLFGERVRANAIAGTLIFLELSRTDSTAAAMADRLAADGLARAIAEQAPGQPLYGFTWSDDLFLATVVPARAATPAGIDMAARVIERYAERLQRPDGLFNHAADAPVAWGRGNGFAALGLMETLTAMPASHPSRARVLEIYLRLLAGMRAQQAPDGMWRQVVDVPGSYRELTATAQTVTAMARGIRLGWLDRTYMPIVERAWRALLAHVDDSGTFVDVCASTVAGPTLRYYLDRPAIDGADDRGAAMTMGAALEMLELNRRP